MNPLKGTGAMHVPAGTVLAPPKSAAVPRKCGFCSKTPTAFPRIFSYDSAPLPGQAHHTQRWGVCTDHAIDIPRHPDRPWSLGPFEGGKAHWRSVHEARYAFPVTAWELTFVKFDSADGMTVLASLGGAPAEPPKLEPVLIDMFSDADDFKAAWREEVGKAKSQLGKR